VQADGQLPLLPTAPLVERQTGAAQVGDQLLSIERVAGGLRRDLPAESAL
jgi:hypothetical protein